MSININSRKKYLSPEAELKPFGICGSVAADVSDKVDDGEFSLEDASI